MPSLAELKQQYRQSSNQSGQPQTIPACHPDEIAILHERRDHLSARLDKGCEFLNDLAQRVGQDSPEFDRYFAEWLRIKDEYERVCDQITILEARREFAEWLKKQPAPKARIAPTAGGLTRE